MPAHVPGDGTEFAGRVALVTGAFQGIGAAVVRALASRGARVVATDRRIGGVGESPLSQGRKSLGKGRTASATECRGDVTTMAMDVSDPVAVRETAWRIEDELGPLDVLVNVAGILRPGPATDTSDQDWADTFAVNSTGIFHTCRVFAPGMAERRSGCIVTVGSNAAGVPRTEMAAYAASKAAAAMYTKCLGQELAPRGVRCNIVAPGSTDAPIQRALHDYGARQRLVEGDTGTCRNGIPVERIAEPEDIAEAVAFLASDRARHITMQDLYVEGGATLR